jgi:predicted flavoprotein YhiN
MTQTKRFAIAGGGRVGLQTAENLSDQGHEVVLNNDYSHCSPPIAVNGGGGHG